jgi:hypothetical protein
VNDPWETCEVTIAGQHFSSMSLRRRVDDRIGDRQAVPCTDVSGPSSGTMTQVSVNAMTWSVLSSPTDRVTHYASSNCTMVGTSAIAQVLTGCPSVLKAVSTTAGSDTISTDARDRKRRLALGEGTH